MQQIIKIIEGQSEKKEWNKEFAEHFPGIYDALSQGLIYAHRRIHDNTQKSLEASSFLYALIEILLEKNILSIEELDERKKQVAERLVKKFSNSGIGLMYQDPEYDKYTFDQETFVDCQSRIHVCKARCCKFPFALSRQDVEEGIVRWEFKRPYLISHDADGYCVHLDKQTYRCSVHEYRPVPCRGFDCRESERWKVWQNYEKTILSPELYDQILHANQVAYNSNHSK